MSRGTTFGHGRVAQAQYRATLPGEFLRQPHPQVAGRRRSGQGRLQELHMSNSVQALVWDAEIPNPYAKMIAVKLADWANDNGGSIFPALATEAWINALSRSTVCKWHYAFEHCGLLKVVRRSLGGTRTTE